MNKNQVDDDDDDSEYEGQQKGNEDFATSCPAGALGTYPSSAIKSPNSLLACSSFEFLILGRSPLRLSSYCAPFNMVIMVGAFSTNSARVSAGMVMWFNKNSVACRLQSGDNKRLKSSLLNLAKASRVGQNMVNVELNMLEISSLCNLA